jgi:2'-5' RNA ligase
MPAVLRRSRPPLPRYAVAWFPAFEGLDRIEAFRRRHDPMATLIPAHLTLVFPFATALKRLQVETHVKRVVSRWPALPVSFRTVRLQANEFVFLMAARGATSVVALHDKLYTRSLRLHLRADIPYEPHITIARNASLPALEAAFDEARERFGAELCDTMREVSLLSVGADGRIQRLADIALHTA